PHCALISSPGRPPPRPPPLPYTTLFRSWPAHTLHWPRTQIWVPVLHSPTLVPQGRVRPSSMVPSQSLSTPSQISALGTQPPHTPDRKSTRLNSSHVKISYAVFCYQKKTA